MNRKPVFKNLEVAGYPASVTIVEGRAPSRPSKDKPDISILALHGFTGSSLDFQPLWETEIGSHYTWICPDFIGHGRSASPEDLEPYSLQNAITLISEARKLAPDPDKVNLIAYSMGGRIALHYLAAASALPACLIGTSPGLASADERNQRRLQDQKWIELLRKPGSIQRFCNLWEAQPLIATQAQLPDPLRSQLKERRRSNNATGLANSLACCGTGSIPSLWNQLGKFNAFKLIHGEKDEKFAAIAGHMKQENPLIEINPIADCGHAPHLEDPEAVMRVLGF